MCGEREGGKGRGSEGEKKMKRRRTSQQRHSSGMYSASPTEGITVTDESWRAEELAATLGMR